MIVLTEKTSIFPKSIMFWILVFSCPKMTLITIFTRMTHLCFVLCNVSGRVCDYNSLSLPGDWRWCSVRRWEIKLEKREDQSNGKAHSLGSKGQHTSTNSHWLFHNWWSSYFFTPNLTFFLNKRLDWKGLKGKIISTLLTKPSDRCSRSSLIGVVA